MSAPPVVEDLQVLEDRIRQFDSRFPSLSVVEDQQSLWIRAENRRRLWLDLLRDDPLVPLTRSGQTISYRPTPFDDPDSQAYVDRMFREKYGRPDQLRGWVMPRDTVPIRLERP